MTTTPSAATPKKNYTKMAFIVIGFVLALFGIDHFTTKWITGGTEITVTDSTIVISPIIDSTKEKLSQPLLLRSTALGGEQVDLKDWIGKNVIIKNTANLNWLLSAFPGAGTFKVTDENTTQIQVNDITTTWLSKNDFERVP